MFDVDVFGVNLVQALIPILVPLVVAGAKKLVPMMPKFAVPLVAMGLGFALDALQAYIGGGDFTPFVGALLGAAGVFVREFVTTIQQHGADPVGKPS